MTVPLMVSLSNHETLLILYKFRMSGQEVRPSDLADSLTGPSCPHYNGRCPVEGEGQSMRKDLMEILACPLCKGPLELTVEEEKGAEVVSGSLFCPKCSQRYPIEDSIPNLLPPELRD